MIARLLYLAGIIASLAVIWASTIQLAHGLSATI